jgi:hypothetical protein
MDKQHKDATFADGADKPLRLIARGAEDLAVISALVQDGVLTGDAIRWQAGARRFALLVNRFRWEDRAQSAERVQSLLSFEDVMAVRSSGITRDADTVLSVLSVGFTPGADGTGRVDIVLAGDGAIALEVECLEVALRDVTRPYGAPSGKRPDHAE